MSTDHIVLDTSVFTNPEVAKTFGQGTTQALARFTELARRVRDDIRFYMPPSVMNELQHFVDASALPADLELVVHLQAPGRHKVQVPGSFLYELIDDVRHRVDKGLRVAEKAVREAQPDKLEKSIHSLRDSYRSALRTGLLDSTEDLDVILLAFELGAGVCSSDQGLMRWAETAGLRLIPPERLRGILERCGEDEE